MSDVDGVAVRDPRTMELEDALREATFTLHVCMDVIDALGDMAPEEWRRTLPECRETIDTLFRDFHEIPDPRDFDSPIQSLQNTMRSLGVASAADAGFGTEMVSRDAFAAFDEAEHAVMEWTGRAASAFITNYAVNFEPRTANLYAIAGVLLNALYAEKAMWLTARADIAQTAIQSGNAMKALIEDDGMDWEVFFKVLTAVTGLASAIPGVGIAFAVVSAASGFIEDEAGRAEDANDALDQIRTGNIEGESPVEILASARQQLNRIPETISRAEAEILTALVRTSITVEANSKYFRFPEVELAEPTVWASDDGMGEHD